LPVSSLAVKKLIPPTTKIRPKTTIATMNKLELTNHLFSLNAIANANNELAKLNGIENYKLFAFIYLSKKIPSHKKIQ